MLILEKQPVAIVGAGKVGLALAVLLYRLGYPIVGLAGRKIPSLGPFAGGLQVRVSDKPAEITIAAQVVFITTTDRAITPVTEAIYAAGGFREGQVVFHTSGSQSAEDMAVARQAGAYIGSMHPLQSFANAQMALEHLPGSFFALEGDEKALAVGEQIVKDLGGRGQTIASKDKALYHAAACIASNYLVALMHLATGLYQGLGLSRQEAFQALLPLIQGTISNIEQLTPASALTGPIARGDDGTVAKHLAALGEFGSQERELYRVLALYTLGVAREKGSIDPVQEAKLEDICKEA